MQSSEAIDTIVIGGGQAGLSVGYHLSRRGVPFLILEANDRVGDSWRQRWDSLRLFTPARFDGLAGMPFPGDRHRFPTKDEMGDYLEAYARHFGLPVKTGVRVDRLSKSGDGLLVSAGDQQFIARHVVVAMANYQRPRVPAFARELDPGIVQLHSSAYRNPAQLRPGGVLVVGAGNSGAELAAEFARNGHRTWLSGKESGEVPFRFDSAAAQLILLKILFRVVFHRILSTSSPVGRRVRPRMLVGAAPLIRVKRKDLSAIGVVRVPRTAGIRNGRPLLDDGELLDVTNVVWCTGYEPGFSWIDLPVFDSNGQPLHRRGVSLAEPGLSFVGLHFLHAMSSAMIHGVGRDAEYIAERIASASHVAVSAGAELRDIELVPVPVRASR
ncbi:MAG TPA: NAD(P)/FAD-dependent oxidoreductase [Gemmatimonadales bacterium]|nr:NAD(P)/FAD-dependent oxidoreductase [Gemmatimonadales bacterium]